jgi:pimeloyl-ACP methyl ester carboxylesterase
MFNSYPPSSNIHIVELPLSRLNVLETGRGEPLIIVPATISELENWRTLAEFMGQWFHVYFFELPGHGKSSPFPYRFSSYRVAELVEQLVNHLGFERFNLMGFSFGGILAMRTYQRLSHRIDRLILIAPCLGRPTLHFSVMRLSVLSRLNRMMGHPRIQARLNKWIHDRRTVSTVVKILRKAGNLENTIPLEDRLLHIPQTTLSVLNAQVDEILNTTFEIHDKDNQTSCYFAMSTLDPLLSFEAALETVNKHFENVKTVRLSYPYHQPPKPFTFEELNNDFYGTVNEFMQNHSTREQAAPC